MGGSVSAQENPKEKNAEGGSHVEVLLLPVNKLGGGLGSGCNSVRWNGLMGDTGRLTPPFGHISKFHGHNFVSEGGAAAFVPGAGAGESLESEGEGAM